MGITVRHVCLPLVVAAAVVVGGCAAPDPAEALTEWGQDGGAEMIRGVAQAMELTGTRVSPGEAHAYCANLDEVAARAQRHPPIPDPVAQQHWARALMYARLGARSCVNQAVTGDRRYARETVNSRKACIAEAELATARIEAVRGVGASWRRTPR